MSITRLTATALALTALAPAAAIWPRACIPTPSSAATRRCGSSMTNHATLNFASDRLPRTAAGKVDAKIVFVNGARVTDIKPVGTHGYDIRYTARVSSQKPAEAPPEVHGEVPPGRREDRVALRQAVRRRRARLVAAVFEASSASAGGASRRERPHRGEGVCLGAVRQRRSSRELPERMRSDAIQAVRQRPRSDRRSLPSLDAAVSAAHCQQRWRTHTNSALYAFSAGAPPRCT